MPEESLSLYVIIVIVAVAVFGLALSAASFATDQPFGRMMSGGTGMMNGAGGGGTSGAGPGALEWAVLILSVVLLALAVVLLLRGRIPRPVAPSTPAAVPPASPPPAVLVPTLPASAPAAGPSPPAERVPEPALVKLLDEDERRMYLELREHGGEMLQRDLVALGIFSKAKVTRVLDKLETKGVVVREAHGMTNRVRLVGAGPR